MRCHSLRRESGHGIDSVNTVPPLDPDTHSSMRCVTDYIAPVFVQPNQFDWTRRQREARRTVKSLEHGNMS